MNENHKLEAILAEMGKEPVPQDVQQLAQSIVEEFRRNVSGGVDALPPQIQAVKVATRSEESQTSDDSIISQDPAQPAVRLAPGVPTELADGVSRGTHPITISPSWRHGLRRFAAILQRKRVRWAAAAAAALIVVAFLVPWRGALTTALTDGTTKPQPILVVISVRQPATDDKGRAIRLGDRLAAGCRVATGEKGRISLITRRGSELTLNSSSTLMLAQNGRDATLSKGRLYCRNREHEFAAINTAAGKIELLGTTVDTAVKDNQTVDVTVVEGKVRLENTHGQAVVDSGKKSILIAQHSPESGETVNTAAETAWYDGRRIISDYGKIPYAVIRGDQNITEVWVMNVDGSGKHRVKSYVGSASSPGPWLPGQQVLLIRPSGSVWAYPDFKNRRADSHSGASLIEPWITWWLLDTATEQDVSITLPPEYDAFHMALSPDATMIAFGGRRIDPANRESSERGTWRYDLHTGAVTKLLDETPEKEPAWSPDGKRLAVTTGSVWSGGHGLRLVVIDTTTGAVSDLNVAGADPCFSPDGTTLAYVAGMTGPRTERDQGRIFVLDLEPGAQPRQISPGPEGRGSCRPQWSPDGKRVLYTVWDQESDDHILKVAAADGSGTVEVYRGMVWPAAWNRTGEALYVHDHEKGMLLVASDASGVIANLGGTENDSPLSPTEDADFRSAQTALRQAVFEHAMGKRYAYYGRPIESRAAHQRSAQLFAEMPWRYPNLGLSLNNALIYADAETAMADQPASQMLLATCKQRLSHAAYLVAAYHAVNGKFAPDLAALKTWAKALPTTMNDVIRLDRDDIGVIFRCPCGEPFTYAPPASGTEPKEGDVMLTCPSHPGTKATWKKRGTRWEAETPSGWRVTNAPAQYPVQSPGRSKQATPGRVAAPSAGSRGRNEVAPWRR